MANVALKFSVYKQRNFHKLSLFFHKFHELWKILKFFVYSRKLSYLIKSLSTRSIVPNNLLHFAGISSNNCNLARIFLNITELLKLHQSSTTLHLFLLALFLSADINFSSAIFLPCALFWCPSLSSDSSFISVTIWLVQSLANKTIIINSIIFSFTECSYCRLKFV